MEPEKCDSWFWMSWEELIEVGKTEELFLPMINLFKEHDLQSLG